MSKQGAAAYMELGKLWLSSNQNAAIANYLKAIDLEPDNYLCYAEFAGAYAKLHYYKESICNYNRAIELVTAKHGPQMASEFYYKIGVVYRLSEQYRQAIISNNKAITWSISNETIASAHYNNILCYIRMYNREAALEEVTKALKINPNNKNFVEIFSVIAKDMDEYPSNNGFVQREESRRQNNPISRCCKRF